MSLTGNIAHAVLPTSRASSFRSEPPRCLPSLCLPPYMASRLAGRAGASGRVYIWAVCATAAIGAGAFAVSFLALRDLMLAIGYSAGTAWIFPAIRFTRFVGGSGVPSVIAARAR